MTFLLAIPSLFVENAIKTALFSSKRRKALVLLTIGSTLVKMEAETFLRRENDLRPDYEPPVAEVIPVSNEDIVRTSSGRNYSGEWDLEW